MLVVRMSHLARRSPSQFRKIEAVVIHQPDLAALIDQDVSVLQVAMSRMSARETGSRPTPDSGQ